MSPTRRDTSAVRRSWYQSEAASFLDHYSPEIVQHRFTNFDPHFYRQKTTLDKIAQRSRRQPRPWQPLFDYVDSHWNTIGPLLPITSSFLEISLLLFLFTLYYTLPADPRTGQRPPRIADLYSIFPFISCIGSQRLPVYQGLTMCVVLINLASTSIGFYRGRDDRIGWQSRRTNWLVSVVSGGLAIWAVFAAANPDTHLHLTVTAAKALSVFCIKTSSWITDHLQRRSYPGLWQTGVVRFLVWWKAITLVVAFRTYKPCFSLGRLMLDSNRDNDGSCHFWLLQCKCRRDPNTRSKMLLDHGNGSSSRMGLCTDYDLLEFDHRIRHLHSPDCR